MTDTEKLQLYLRIQSELEPLMEAANDAIAAMATFVSVLRQHLSYVSWVGFYRVVDTQLLRIGPYQGPVGCLEIPFGQGVCGTVALKGSSLVVPDVHVFPGHIACDAQARSEIVVPVWNRNHQLVAVLDLDSHELEAFNQVDQKALEQAVELLRPLISDSQPTLS